MSSERKLTGLGMDEATVFVGSKGQPPLYNQDFAVMVAEDDIKLPPYKKGHSQSPAPAAQSRPPPPPYSSQKSKEGLPDGGEEFMDSNEDADMLPRSEAVPNPLISAPGSCYLVPPTPGLFFAPLAIPLPTSMQKDGPHNQAAEEEMELRGAPVFTVLAVILFFCGGCFPLFFFFKAYLAKKEGNALKARTMKLKGVKVSGLPICLLILVSLITTIVVVTQVQKN